MRSRLPSPGRILLLVFIAAAVFGTGAAATFVTLGIRADRAALAEVEAQDAAAIWMEITDRFERLTLADPFLLPAADQGDAAALYWPEGEAPADCGSRTGPGDVRTSAMLFERYPDAMAAAVRCPRLDDLVRAAAMPDADMVGRLDAADPDFDFFAAYEQFREPRAALTALLARSYARMQAREWLGAERDARAAISAGRHFVWNSPDASAISMGIQLMMGGLDHLRELHERRGNADRAALASGVRDSLAELQRSWGRVMDVAMETSTFPKTIRYTVAAAENEGLPLGLRSTAVVTLGYGHVGHTIERLLGPSRDRVRALARLEREPELRPAVHQARKGLELSWRERQDLATQWNL